jgi:c(7)-type cytochrome triheme protein
MTRGIRRLVVAAALAGGTAAAAGMPKLPADAVLPQSEESIGPVTFRHSTHVDERRPDCVACHPRLFRVLEKGRTAGGEVIRHGEMEKGRQCGACHGRGAFGLDDCTLCHG